MPPQLPGPHALRGLTLCLRPAVTPSFQPRIQTANYTKKERANRHRAKQDPYGWAQAQQRKQANESRQAELKAQRDATWGSPIHGITTPFVESFDSGGQAPYSTPPVDANGKILEEPHPLPTSPHVLNFLVSKEELDDVLQQCYEWHKPLPPSDPNDVDPIQEAQELEAHEAHHAKAVKALTRITNLANGNSKDIKHANTRRCIETFGRHVTDTTVPNAAPPKSPEAMLNPPKPPRAGPDTGSSEVQIAILTTKIRALAAKLEGPKGHKDKNNKKSIRMLCHRRQALMRYMERKERGSGRWLHMLETLGLSPATWKEQIILRDA